MGITGITSRETLSRPSQSGFVTVTDLDRVDLGSGKQIRIPKVSVLSLDHRPYVHPRTCAVSDHLHGYSARGGQSDHAGRVGDDQLVGFCGTFIM